MTKRQWESSDCNNLTYECRQVWSIYIESCDVRAKMVNLSKTLNEMLNGRCQDVRNRHIKATQGRFERVGHFIWPTVTFTSTFQDLVGKRRFLWEVKLHISKFGSKMLPCKQPTWGQYKSVTSLLLVKAAAGAVLVNQASSKWLWRLSWRQSAEAAWSTATWDQAALAIITVETVSRRKTESKAIGWQMCISVTSRTG